MDQQKAVLLAKALEGALKEHIRAAGQRAVADFILKAAAGGADSPEGRLLREHVDWIDAVTDPVDDVDDPLVKAEDFEESPEVQAGFRMARFVNREILRLPE